MIGYYYLARVLTVEVSPVTEANPQRETQTKNYEELPSRSKSRTEIREAVADHIDHMDGNAFVSRLLTARHRHSLFEQASGRVLDVACGTGTNRQYLPESTEYVGIDISPEMLVRAESRFEELERDETLLEMDAENLEFEDDSFETVISSMSTCMFPSPVTALDEMGRVCEPDGQVLLLEHGRSDNSVLARLQDWRADARYQKMGCQWNQEPLDIVTKSGLAVRESDSSLLGLITAIEAQPE